MTNRTLFFALSAIGLTLGSVPLSGCGYLKARAARTAYTQYQEALAAGDTARARTALLALVRADEDVGDYWLELGKLQLQLGDYRAAYDAFSHAHELDRGNVQVLATMAELALLSGQVDLADEQANSLAMVAPEHPVVTLVRSHVALRSGELDKAEAGADSLLASTPNDPFARVLKARVLIARDRVDDAIALLEDQHRAVPDDQFSIRALTALYRSRDDWRNVARMQYDAHRLVAKDTSITLAVIGAWLRAGNVPAARQVSAPLLSNGANPQLVDSTLDLWASYAPAGTVLTDGSKLANAASGDTRVAFANYFNRIGKPAAAVTLLGGSQLPVSHVNARWNAVVAQSLALLGQLSEAKRLFDLVLDREPDQVDALRGRSALEARTGLTKQAVIDAQRLVTISHQSGQDRLLLARAYLAAGNGTEVRRILWQAFQDLPEDEGVFSALKNVLASSGDAEGERRLTDELADQRKAKLTKDLV